MTIQFKSATSPAPKSDNLDWKPLDINSLPGDLKAHYEAWREADELAKSLKKDFTDAFRDAVVAPDNTQAVLGFLYGKLSYAFAPNKAKKADAKLVNFAALLKK